ncbi:unnamed protein product [Schistocephalus solidus]|uniref:HECT domain-containing protein n=3 Tax=Schistocephalus solidus TaxID=70667 RepID=A0A183T9Q9_SCHSO|nr:unnamed protein product [Schistocephalus solidus]
MKPDKHIFHCVAERFSQTTGGNLDSEACLRYYAHIGDSPTRDYWGAVRAGCGGGAFLFKPHLTEAGDQNKPSSVPTNAYSTTWAYTEPGLSDVPARNIVPSLLELANRLEVHNRLFAVD